MSEVTRTPTKDIEEVAHPWEQPEDMEALMDRIGDAQYVLLGESSHGTHEFYTWRAQISQKLITEKGFSFIAVEGDWPDCYRLNRYIKGHPDTGENARDVLHGYKRWPAWMWANWEIAKFAEWLREHNMSRPMLERVGFYGLDLYSLWDSIQAVLYRLGQINPAAATRAKEAYSCFDPYSDNVNQYAYSSTFLSESCESDVVRVQKLIEDIAPIYADDYEAAFDVEQNARVVVNAEHYYRTMSAGDAVSWNIRDNHMTETLGELMRHHGPDAKAIVWAHNTHVGDARYAGMSDSGMINIGQLIREEQTEDNVVIVGFGTYSGTVIAGRYWDEPMRILNVPPAREDSWEALMHLAAPQNKLLISDELAEYDSFWRLRDQRAIGVVYNPLRERGNYVPTLLPQRYDAFIYIDHSNALQPLHTTTQGEDVPETFPWAT